MQTGKTDTPVPDQELRPPKLRPITVVTGGSEGIGLELAHCFAQNGRDILLIARDAKRLRQARADIARRLADRKKPPREVFVLALDLTNETALAELDAMLQSHSAYVDVLVNNAGIGLSAEFSEQSPDQLQALLQLNINALTKLMRHVLPGMSARKAGGVLNVASLGGFAPGPYQAIYYASKSYVISLSEAVAAEMHHTGVRICVLAPGPVRTHFHKRMGSQNDFYYRFLPVLSASRTASVAYRGFIWRRRVIVPGFINLAMALSLRLLPHQITIPIIGLLLRPRKLGSNNA